MADRMHQVLVVDDNNKNLQLTAGILKDEGFLVSLATSGQSALSLLENYTPDLILLDVMMPEMDGLETCRIIKSNKILKQIPIIFLTAMDQPGDLSEGFKVGGVDYVTKPFIREELLSRIRTHIDLAASMKTILEFNRIRDRLYLIIAHDIRSPFSSIKMTINSIASGIIDMSSEDFTEMIIHLEKTVDETSLLLDNLLNYTKYQGQDVKLLLKIQEIYPVIKDSIAFLSENANAKGISIRVNLPVGLTALFEENSMQAVFRNLISNAIKFTPSGGFIDIFSETDDNTLRLHIKDTGIGMPIETIEKIFLKNEHHFSTGTNSERGSGLGLFIVRDLINLNNCRILSESKPGEGTDIILIFNS